MDESNGTGVICSAGHRQRALPTNSLSLVTWLLDLESCHAILKILSLSFHFRNGINKTAKHRDMHKLGQALGPSLYAPPCQPPTTLAHAGNGQGYSLPAG